MIYGRLGLKLSVINRGAIFKKITHPFAIQTNKWKHPVMISISYTCHLLAGCVVAVYEYHFNCVLALA